MKKQIVLIMTGIVMLALHVKSETPVSKQHKNRTTIVQTVAYEAAVKVTQGQFASLTAEYLATNPISTLGGLMSKSMLQDLIESMPNSDSYINFRFATDDGNTSLMLMGGKTWYEGDRKIVCMRNGGSVKSYCPINCGFGVNEPNTSMTMAYSEYQTLSQAYQAANPSKTWGGNIDKSAMLELINSIPAEATNIGFMFCTDPDFGKTGVIFIGGSAGQVGGSVLYFRNGVTADSFCPSMCSIRE